jgi:poly(3-hydroxybutyrate) depolymerase
MNGLQVPLIVFHSDDDTTVTPINATSLVQQALQGHPNGQVATQTTEGQVPGGRSYTQITYRDGNGRTIVEQWTVHGGGHAWAGGSSSGSYTDPQGPDASAEFVRFFATHRRTH